MFKNKILKKNSWICEKFSPKKKKRKKKKLLHGERLFYLSGWIIMYVHFSSGKSHGIQIPLHVQERIIIFCLTNHMDAHVGECLAIHHLGLVPDWGEGTRRRWTSRILLQAKVFLGCCVTKREGFFSIIYTIGMIDLVERIHIPYLDIFWL